MTTLWTSHDLEEATAGAATQAFDATGVSIDTRTLKKGELYVALKGETLDGHAYVDAAFKAGASGALVREDFSGAGPLVRVRDTLEALEDLGRFARARSKAKIIAVTGSAGKTGTKEMLAVLLGALGKTHASKKSFNNHWGVPLTLANLPQDAAYGVFEMGMNHPGELAKLSPMVHPHIAIVTTIETVHAEFFKNAEAIADAKAEIFEGIGAGGTAILNLDNPHFARLKAHAEKRKLKVVAFGEDDAAEARLVDCTLHADSTKVEADILGERVHYKLNIPGKHIALNSLAALAAVKLAGGNLQKAAAALKDAAPVEGRGNRLTVTLEAGQPPVTIINEGYNANPASMRAAFEVFSMVAPQGEGRRIAALGDMLELGPNGPALHANLANPLLMAKTDLLFCCGPLMDALYQQIPQGWRGAHAKNSQELGVLLANAVKPGDVVLVKGSAGSKMSYVIQALQEKQRAL